MITNNADNSNNADSRRRQRQEDLGKLLLHRYNNASSQPKNNSQSVTNAENNDVSLSSSSDGPKPPKSDSQSRSTATKDDDSWPSSLRTGIDNFLRRVSPALDPKQQVPTEILDDFFNKVAQWIETPKKPKDNNGRSLYSDLRRKEEYFKSSNLQPNDEENNFFQDSFFDELETLYDEFLRSEAKTLDEIFEGVTSPLYLQPNFPPSLCLPTKDSEGRTTLEAVSHRHQLATDGLSHVPRLKKKDAPAVNQKEEGIYEEHLQFTENNIPVVWQLQDKNLPQQQVIVICGPSGSGKTVASFEIGYLMSHNNNNNNSNNNLNCYNFYFSCGEVMAEIGVDEWRSNAEKCIDFQKQVDKLKEVEKKNDNNNAQMLINPDVPSGEDETEVKVKSQLEQFTTQRNSLVSNAIKRMIKASVEPKNNWLPRLKPSTTASTTHVNIIIDEIGSDIRVLRALAAACEDLARRLHGYLFGEDPNPLKERVRVHFIAAGTGANFAPGDAASEKHTASCLYLGPQKAIFKTLLEQNAQKLQSSPILKELYERLHNAAESTPPKQFEDPMESILADLITNPRCAALLINRALKLPQIPTLCSGGVAPWIPLLTSVVETTVHEFTAMNGLAKFYVVPEVISFALAFVALRFPEMPECPAIAENVLRPKPGYVKTLPNLLCTVSGLIVDTIRKCPPESIGPENFAVQGVLGFLLERGRHECSPAFAAMFKYYHRNQGRSKWETVESNVADVCVLVTKYSMSLKAVDDDLREHHNDLYNRYFVQNRARLEEFDPLFPLKKEWLIYPASACVVGSKRKELKREKVVNHIYSASTDEKDSIIKKYREKIFGDSSSSSPDSSPSTSTGNSTVVMISAPREPFADVIVAGPGRLILLQCKRLDAVDKKINFENEFGKMGALASRYANDDTAKEETWKKSRKYVNFLKEFCRKNKNDPVDVFAAVILETESKSVLDECQKKYDKYNELNYTTDFTLGFFGYAVEPNSAHSRSPLYPLTVGLK